MTYSYKGEEVGPDDYSDFERRSGYDPGVAMGTDDSSSKPVDEPAPVVEEPVVVVPPAAFRSSNTSFMGKGSNREIKNLIWRDVNMTLKAKKGNEVEKNILHNVWGEARGGETTAIMGASGAGKTSLFNVLAGRASSNGRIVISSNIRLGNSVIDPTQPSIRNMFAFVAQEDSLHTPSTPRQALTFSARLRLPKSTTNKQIDDLVNVYIDELGLKSAADTLIGGGLRKGISGGEKRRVSIGVELISEPSIIFLDEPTSGLDSFAARQVMSLLQKVADAGNIVLFTIHQPSSDVFASFDRLVLLNRGRLMYQGLIKDINDDFERNGYPVPKNYNPADWLLDVSQMNEVEDLEEKGFFPMDKRTILEASEVLKVPQTDQAGIWTQFAMLMQREKISFVKNPLPLLISVFITGFLALIFGAIFWQIGAADRSLPGVVQGQLGALINVNIATMMGQAQGALVVFAQERPLFLREYSTKHYSILPYFVSHLASELVKGFLIVLAQALIAYFMIGFQQSFFQFLGITFALAVTSTAVAVLLGSFFTDAESANALFTLVVVPQFYFSGVFIAITLIPEWIRWAQYLCSLTYASRLSLSYEFQDCEPGLATVNCNTILEQNQSDPENIWWYWLALVGLFIAFRTSALFVLRKKGSTFN